MTSNNEANKRRDFIIVLGNQGAGKSVWVKQRVAYLQRLCVFDPMASYPNVDFETPLENVVDPILDGEKKTFRVGVWDSDDVDALGSLSFAAGNSTLVIEEAGVFFTRGQILEDWTKRLVYMGRHQCASVIFVAQRAQSIPIAVRSQATRIITFRQTEPEDVKIVCQIIGKQFRDDLPALPDLACLDWHKGKLTAYSVDPKKLQNVKQKTTIVDKGTIPFFPTLNNKE